MHAFWGFTVRFLQALTEAAPFLLTGFFVAAVFGRFLGTDRTRALFSGPPIKSLLKAWVIGMLLPVCSLGVIPVAAELRRAGVRGGTILAFAMSAPLFNPLSLLYGLTLSEPIAILSFAGCSLIIVTCVGLLWDRWFPDTGDSEDQAQPAVHYGIRRMVALGSSAGKHATGRAAFLVFLGLCGVGALGALIPFASLQHSFNYDQLAAPLRMTWLGIPVYATPMLAMSQMGMMFQHANSIGAAFVLLILGAGMNMGLMAWMLFEYGFRKSIAWLVILLPIVLGLGYAVNSPLHPHDVEPANHTHAFDIYGAPFSAEQPAANLPSLVAAKLQRDIEPYKWYSLQLCGLLILGGIIVRIADRRGKLEEWISEQAEANNKVDVVIPGPVLAGITLVGLVVLSVVGCFAYYPPADQVFGEMRIARVEALSAALSGDETHTEYWVDVYQEWTRKLEVGTYLRSGEISEYRQWKARLVREQLEMLKHAVEEGERDEAKYWVNRVQKSHDRMKAAFRVES